MNNYIETKQDLDKAILENGYNPLEETMGKQLLAINRSFFYQYEIDVSSFLQNGLETTSRRKIRPDILIPDVNTVIELDGVIHAGREDIWHRDVNKNNIYTFLRLSVFHFTWDQVMTHVAINNIRHYIEGEYERKSKEIKFEFYQAAYFAKTQSDYLSSGSPSLIGDSQYKISEKEVLESLES